MPHRRHRGLLTVAVALALALAATALPGGGAVGAQAGDGPPPELSGEQATTPPPPDPEGDIDPYRPSEDGVITPQAAAVRPIRFPLAAYSSYVDTFGACRDGCTRFHEGIDIFAPKRTHIIAAADGHVTWLRTDASGTAGNGVGITDAAGWRYLYLHVNNDNPGTDDGANPARWRFISGMTMGMKVYKGQILGYSGDSGNAEGTPPHLHFELRTPDGVDINPYASLRNANRARPVPRLFRFDQLRGGAATDHLAWGTTGTTAIMSCDLDGDGDDEPVFRQGATFWLAPSGTDTRVRTGVNYGTAGDLGLCGDWDGNGTDTPGVRRGNVYLLRNAWTSGSAQLMFGYGRSTDRPVVGDWNGDRVDTIGVFRGGTWFLNNRNAGGAASVSFVYGVASDRPVPGDWNGDGTDTVGVRRGVTMYVRNAPGAGPTSMRFNLGTTGDGTLVADWASAPGGGDTISVWRRHPK